MENNEQIEETQEEFQEETQETAPTAGEVEEKDSQEETIEELKAKVAKYKAIAERKDKKLQKQPKQVDNKSNDPTGNLTRQEAILISKGATEEDLEIANKVAKVEGISVLEAWEDSYVQSSIEKRKAEEQVKKNKIGASNGSPNADEKQKSPGEMTREEHQSWFREKIAQ